MISLDSETTGVDFNHGARPFFVTICHEDGTQQFYEWDINPLTREVIIPQGDIKEISDILEVASGWGKDFDEEIASRHKLVLQNPKFDATALHSIGITKFPWHQVYDTLMAGHLLASGLPHDLTSMALQYLGMDIQPYEDRLRKAVEEGRRYCRIHQPDWAIAKYDRPDMPSCPKSKKDTAGKGNDRDTAWKYDMWLPRALRQYGLANNKDGILGDRPEWDTVLQEYSNTDSAVTLFLMKEMMKELKSRNLWKIYEHRLKLIPIAQKMELDGITLSKERLNELKFEYKSESRRTASVCVNIAAGYNHELELPKGGAVNGSLRSFIFDKLKLERVVKPKAKTDQGSLDKETMRYYLGTLPHKSKQLHFMETLAYKRKCDTDLKYMEGYERFWLPTGIIDQAGQQLWYRVHSNLNPTGTAHLRWSSSNPNEQNIGKQEDECKWCDGDGCYGVSGNEVTCERCNGTGKTRRSVRYCFGPQPGREWWSLDYKNLERRIPAYEAGEEEIIALFEAPNDPPYFGSEHLLVSHILYPKEFEACKVNGEIDGRAFKKKYASTLYQWVKNGNFAIQYNAGPRTADRTFRVDGAHHILKSRFAAQEDLNQACIRHAEQFGYVETIPDKDVDPNRGYPIMCNRSGWGNISPTIPLNYHTSGTACWIMGKAMIRVQAKLDEWQARDPKYGSPGGWDGFIAMQVHDELVLDFPKSTKHPKDVDEKSVFSRAGSNLWRARVVQKLMTECGDGVGIPTPVSIEYHEHNWSQGLTF